MELSLIQTSTSPIVDEIMEQMMTLNLVEYASSAFSEMEFDSTEELFDAVKRAMDLCLSADLPIKGNFQQVYKCSSEGIIYDWKLSTLAYRLVCMNGKTSNPNVARLMITLIKNEHLNHF
jgi:hypothetical protein